MEEARRECFTTLEINPDAVHPLMCLGLMAMTNNQHDEAERYFDRVEQVDPGSPDLANARAHLALTRGRVDEAVRLFEALVQQHPDHPSGRSGLAMARAEQRRRASGEADDGAK